MTASVINIKKDGFDELYYPEIDMDTGAAFYAVNTGDPDGELYLEAFVSFMSERYNGANSDHGMIGKWTVGNEVNESGTYNYMGERRLDEYIKEYSRTFRIVYNIIKSNIPNADVYIPMEPWWKIESGMLTYGGKEFLDAFNGQMREEGNVDWGLAYHAYSYPLCDPKVLNDDSAAIDDHGNYTTPEYYTKDSLDSTTITMENIDVLIDYMHTPEYLTRDGQVRSIILSEQGYTSNSNVYGKCEAEQAASIVYSYYKAEMNEDIDAFIYFLQCDTAEASLNNDYYQFGLWGVNSDGTYHEKLSHDVLKIMDTKESLELLENVKKILGINDWIQVIPNFTESRFTQFRQADLADLEEFQNKCSIDEATIENIENQKYTGKECVPNVKVMCNGEELINDVDYDVVYFDNIEVGTATVLIVGLNDYAGTCSTTFKINP